MNRYRSYMDRIVPPAGLWEKCLAGALPRRRSRPALAAGALAACCLAAAVGGWQVWQGTALVQPDPTAGVAATPGTIHQAEQETAYTLVVDDPFGGQPHSFPCITAYDFPDCTGAPSMAADYAYPDGWFTAELTAAEIISVLGGTDRVPWELNWTGFGLDGTVIYDGAGNPWRIDITGGRGEEQLQLTLWPGQEPLIDLIYADAAAQSADATTYSLHGDRDGDGNKEYVYHAHYFDGAIGVEFEYIGFDQDSGPVLASLAVQYRGRFTADSLTPDAVPEWRSETLDLEQLYGEELARYLPDSDALPEGFVFDSGHRELGQDRDWLAALWYRGYDEVSVQVERILTPRTDEKLRTDFLPGEVTAQALEQLGSDVDSDRGDSAGWRYEPFTVYFQGEDGVTVAVTWSIKGLGPEEAAALVNH